jgi:uncharacterized repeat protein (TIGR01451 family)
MRLRKPLLGIVLGIVLVLGATTQLASAKSVAQVPATCSAGTAGYGITLQAGSTVTVGFGATGLSSAGTWHTLIGEAGLPPMIDYTAVMGQQWTVSTNRTLTSGLHVVSVTVNNVDTGEICTSGMQFLVGGGGGGGGGTTVALPDIQMSGSPSTGSPAAGAQFSYTYQIKNSGQATATAVTFTDVLPSELAPLGFKSVTVNDGSACTAPVLDSNQVLISCDLGDMAPGAQKTVTVVVTAPPTSGTIVVNTATAYQTNGDSNWGNGDRKISVTVR